MVDSLDFLTVMVILYLVECLRRVGPDELTLDRRLHFGFRLKRPVPYPNSTHWGWILLNPLRPDGPTFSLMPAAGLFAESGSLPADEVSSRNLDAARFDLNGIKEACAELRGQTSGVRRMTLALLAVCFGLFPACLFFLGVRATLPPAAVVVFLASICIAALYRRSIRLIAPRTPALDLYVNMAKLVLYPISAIRCMDLLSRECLATFDPIAVATVLCGCEAGARLAAGELIILRCTVTPQGVDSDSKGAMNEYRAARVQLLEWFITQHALPVQAFIDPPAPSDESCLTYCPVCRSQFRLPEGACHDCTGILLQPLRISKCRQAVGSKEEGHA